MKKSIYKNYDELPLFLNAKILAEVLGIAPSSAYEIMHEKGFPVLKVGNRLLVEKYKFKEWIELNTGG
ncbi:MAG: helix-turn-helix domain-containing protein [Clostridia bacterium]|nr:helix-turn-helix domain-containing protein [Clostridia bacterium]